jgi:hypothetical protein
MKSKWTLLIYVYSLLIYFIDFWSLPKTFGMSYASNINLFTYHEPLVITQTPDLSTPNLSQGREENVLVCPQFLDFQSDDDFMGNSEDGFKLNVGNVDKQGIHHDDGLLGSSKRDLLWVGSENEMEEAWPLPSMPLLSTSAPSTNSQCELIHLSFQHISYTLNHEKRRCCGEMY